MLTSYLKYNIPKLKMHTALIAEFNLAQNYIDACEKYYVLHWRGDHFKHVLKDGAIIHQGVRYLVCYKNCTPHDIKTNSRLFMSFRKPAKEFELAAYVLVSRGGRI